MMPNEPMWGEGAKPLDVEKPQTKAEKRAAAGKTPRKKPKPLKERIPVVPAANIQPEELVKPDMRSKACVNMKLAGAGFHEIAKELGYATAKDAETAYISALANMYPVENWETLRQTAALRAEQRFRRSNAMASADFLVDANDPKQRKIANPDRLRWHEQEGKDLALWVTITGAKAPARMEISADTAMLTQIASALLAGEGGAPEIEASVWDIDDVPDEDIQDAEEV